MTVRHRSTREPQQGWRRGAIARLAGRAGDACLGCGASADVHMALLDEGGGDIAVLTYACADGTLPSRRRAASAGDPAGTRHSRSARLEAVGAAGHAAVARSTGRLARLRRAAVPYRLPAAEGEGLHQIPVGPVHAGIIEPGHFRFTANGETVVRLEERLGYVHKGIETLMAGAALDTAAKLAGAHLRRQHGRLCLRLRLRRRGRAADRRRRRAPPICAR